MSYYPPPSGYPAQQPPGYPAQSGYPPPPPPPPQQQQYPGYPPQQYPPYPPPPQQQPQQHAGYPPQAYQQYPGPPPPQGYLASPQAYGSPPAHGQYPPAPQYGGQLPPPMYGGPNVMHGQAGQHNYGGNPQAVPMPVLGQFGLPATPGTHTAAFSQTFKVEELVASATQDSFEVKDMTGRLRYKIDGSFTVNERKTMKDMHGRELLKLSEARMAMRERITISGANGQPVLTIQQSSGAQLGAKSARAYLGGHASGAPVFTIEGGRKALNFRVTAANGMELAVITRKAGGLKTRLTGQDSYETVVMPGVDQALMCMVTVACDEIWSD
jgi:uncharacterized protein YxjI